MRMDDGVQPILAVPVEPAVVNGEPGADAGAGAAHARSGAETLKDLVAKECASEREAFKVAQYDLAQSRRRTAEAKRAMKQARQELERAQRKEHDLQKRVLKQRERWNSAQRDAAQKFQKEAERRQQEQARRRVEEERSKQRREDAEVRAREAREAEKSLREQAEQKAREAKHLAEAALRLHEENNALMASRRDAPSQSHAALLPSGSASSARRGKHSSKGFPRRTGLDEWGVSRAKERAKQRRQQMRGADQKAGRRRSHRHDQGARRDDGGSADDWEALASTAWKGPAEIRHEQEAEARQRRERRRAEAAERHGDSKLPPLQQVR